MKSGTRFKCQAKIRRGRKNMKRRKQGGNDDESEKEKKKGVN